MTDASAYNITVRKGSFDGEVCFEARVRELPDLREYGDTHGEAYELALDAIETTAKIFAEKGRKMPAPEVPEDEFSGRVTLRLPKTLHRGLATRAEEEGVSLNQLLVSVLATFRGFDAALEDDRDGWVTLREAERPRIDATKSMHRKVIPISDYKQSASSW